MIEELWKDIESYKGLYMVSNIGRIRSVERYIGGNKKYNKGKRMIKGKIKAWKINKFGYARVSLFKNTKEKSFMVHRLVGIHFIKIPKDLKHLDFHELEINHIDSNKLNNHYTNLEWCTHQENMTHMHTNSTSPIRE